MKRNGEREVPCIIPVSVGIRKPLNEPRANKEVLFSRDDLIIWVIHIGITFIVRLWRSRVRKYIVNCSRCIEI